MYRTRERRRKTWMQVAALALSVMLVLLYAVMHFTNTSKAANFEDALKQEVYKAVDLTVSGYLESGNISGAATWSMKVIEGFFKQHAAELELTEQASISQNLESSLPKLVKCGYISCTEEGILTELSRAYFANAVASAVIYAVPRSGKVTTINSTAQTFSDVLNVKTELSAFKKEVNGSLKKLKQSGKNTGEKKALEVQKQVNMLSDQMEAIDTLVHSVQVKVEESSGKVQVVDPEYQGKLIAVAKVQEDMKATFTTMQTTGALQEVDLTAALAAIDALTAKVRDNAAAIARVTNQVDQNTTTLTGHTDSIKGNTEKISANTATIASLVKQLEELPISANHGFSELLEKLRNNDAADKNLTNTVSSLSVRFEEHAKEINRMASENANAIQKNAATISANEKAANEKIAQTAAELNEGLRKVQQSIEANAALDKALFDDVAALRSTVESYNAKALQLIEANATAIAANKKAIEANKEAIAANEVRIAEDSKSIVKNAEDIQNNFNDLLTKLGENAAGDTALSKELTDLAASFEEYNRLVNDAIKANSTAIQDNAALISANEKEATAKITKVANDLSAGLDSLQKKIDENAALDKALSDDVVTLHSTVESYNTKVNQLIEGNNKSIDALTVVVQENKEKAALDHKTNADNLIEFKRLYDDYCAANDGVLTQYLSRLDGLDRIAEQHAGYINGNSTAINALQQSLATQVSGLDAKIQGNTDLINNSNTATNNRLANLEARLETTKVDSIVIVSAAPHNASTAYTVGEYVIQNNQIWQCATAGSSSWDASRWVLKPDYLSWSAAGNGTYFVSLSRPGIKYGCSIDVSYQNEPAIIPTYEADTAAHTLTIRVPVPQITEIGYILIYHN